MSDQYVKDRNAAATTFAENDFNYWKKESIRMSNPALRPKTSKDYFEAGADWHREYIKTQRCTNPDHEDDWKRIQDAERALEVEKDNVAQLETIMRRREEAFAAKCNELVECIHEHDLNVKLMKEMQSLLKQAEVEILEQGADLALCVEALELMCTSTQFKEGEYGFQFILLAKETLVKLKSSKGGGE